MPVLTTLYSSADRVILFRPERSKHPSSRIDKCQPTLKAGFSKAFGPTEMLPLEITWEFYYGFCDPYFLFKINPPQNKLCMRPSVQSPVPSQNKSPKQKLITITIFNYNFHYRDFHNLIYLRSTFLFACFL